MSPDMTFGLIVLVPVVVLMLLRINAALVFLSLCLGDVLGQFGAEDTTSIQDFVYNHSTVDSAESNIKILLLLTPAALTAIFMIRTIKGRPRLAMNFLPALGVGLLGAMLLVPLLPSGLAFSITDSELWNKALDVQDIIVGASAVVCLIFLWMQRPKKTFAKHEKKKH